MDLGLSKPRYGSGILKEEERTNIFFFSLFLSLSHINHFFPLSLELMITQQTAQFQLCTKDYSFSFLKTFWLILLS